LIVSNPFFFSHSRTNSVNPPYRKDSSKECSTAIGTSETTLPAINEYRSVSNPRKKNKQQVFLNKVDHKNSTKYFNESLMGSVRDLQQNNLM